MNEIIAKSWTDLQELLFEDALDPRLNRFRSQYAFRGHQHANYNLATSLARLGGDFAGMERHIFRNFKKYAHQDVVERDSEWHWLSVAKHHGLPTRLIDWSYSPFVAMHFAVENIINFGIDGAIWCVHFAKAHAMLPQSFKKLLYKEGADMFAVDMLTDAQVTLHDLDRLSPDPYVVFFEPPSIDARIVNQYALFSVMSDPVLLMDDWLNAHPQIWRKIIIPASLKWEVRDKLDQANISERVLFPGLDGLSKFLKRQYSIRE